MCFHVSAKRGPGRPRKTPASETGGGHEEEIEDEESSSGGKK